MTGNFRRLYAESKPRQPFCIHLSPLKVGTDLRRQFGGDKLSFFKRELCVTRTVAI